MSSTNATAVDEDNATTIVDELVEFGERRVPNRKFAQNKHLVSIKLLSSVEEIGDYAFSALGWSRLISPTRLQRLGILPFMAALG